MTERTIAVEVVHAGAGKPILRRVMLREGATVMEAIDASGIAAMFPGGAGREIGRASCRERV